MSFRAWRQQAKLLKAVEWLAAGRSVSDIAFSLGYSSPSAFIAVFRAAFGASQQARRALYPSHQRRDAGHDESGACSKSAAACSHVVGIAGA
ncbi:helix-turn-helix domain-containing protein [Mesorhizobium sp. M0913]